MTEKSLIDAREYFDQVVTVNVDEFLNSPSTFRLAFNAATALFHQHEWLFECKQLELESKYGMTFGSKGAFWKQVETLIPQAAYIRDLANASKHLKLTIRPSTSMSHIANTVIQVSSFGTGAYGVGRYSADSVMMKDSGNDISLDDCVRKLRTFWESLIADIYP